MQGIINERILFQCMGAYMTNDSAFWACNISLCTIWLYIELCIIEYTRLESDSMCTELNSPIHQMRTYAHILMTLCLFIMHNNIKLIEILFPTKPYSRTTLTKKHFSAECLEKNVQIWGSSPGLFNNLYAVTIQITSIKPKINTCDFHLCVWS